MLPKDFENPWGLKTPKGKVRMMSALLNSAVFPGMQGGPLEHVIAAKAIAFGEALTDSYFEYALQVKKNASAMADALVAKGYDVVSGGTDNHCMLIDLRSKNITGKDAENALVKAHITVNKNMVPFDEQSPFITSGIRMGTPCITTCGMKEEESTKVGYLISEALKQRDNQDQIKELQEEIRSLAKQFQPYE